MLATLKVLIVEDDAMIAEMTVDILSDNGYDVCGVAATVEEALELARSTAPDLALIDMRLANNERGTDVARRLRALGSIGVLFTTGNAARVAWEDAEGEGLLVKPYTYDDLLRGLEIVVEILARGEASAPFPLGFRHIAQRV